MNPQTVQDILSGRRRGPAAALLRLLLRAAGVPYAGAMSVRRWAYRRGLCKSRRATVPVICVGNLTTGGTGKTPMVALLVRRLVESGRRPAVLIRGYRPSSAGLSDEAELLRLLCSVPVIADPDRSAGAARAVAQGADVLVMDDGFQHLRLRRDLDIVLIDAREPFGYGFCLPRGLLREPVGAMRDAGAVVLTHAEAVGGDRLSALKRRLASLAPRASVHVAAHGPAGVIDEHGTPQPPDVLSGRKAFAFCGIAGPEGFFAMLESLGACLVGRLAMEDHVAYGPAGLDAVRRALSEAGADVLVTTQKDFVKLRRADLGLPLWQLAVAVRFLEGEADLLAKLQAVLSG